jgi:ATP-dependent protease HslVU (ClpYQ) peptidase subunit
MADHRLREVKLRETFWAIGSGEQAAMVAMHMGATAKEAVEMAKRVDPYTGGRVREFSL